MPDYSDPNQVQATNPVQPADQEQPSAPPQSQMGEDISAYQPPTAPPVNTMTEDATPSQPTFSPPVATPAAPSMSDPSSPSGDAVATADRSAPSSAAKSSMETSEEIADQNIFEMLGVTDGTPEQREQFLDELQSVIWDDFIEHDTTLLLTEEEQGQLKQILQPDPKAVENQEKAVVFLEKLVPDLEEIMLEKALQLKEEMFKERLRAMNELYRNDADKMQQIAQAQAHIEAKRWKSASAVLNSVK